MTPVLRLSCVILPVNRNSKRNCRLTNITRFYTMEMSVVNPRQQATYLDFWMFASILVENSAYYFISGHNRFPLRHIRFIIH